MDSNEGDVLVTVGDDQQIKQWRLDDDLSSESLQEPIRQCAHKTAIRDVTHSWHEAKFATCGEGVDVWDHHRSVIMNDDALV